MAIGTIRTIRRLIVRTCQVLVGAGMLAGIAGAQVVIGGGGTPPVNAILFDGSLCKVKGLAYSATEKPSQSAPPGTQYTEFALSLQYTPPPGWTTTGQYLWKPIWGPGGAIAVGQLRVKGDGTGASATGCAYMPGIHSVSCDIQIKRVNVPDSQSWVSLQGTCAVIGGPLGFSPEAMSFTYSKDTFSSTTKTDYGAFGNATATLPDHDDDDLTKPYHLQYFNFDPRQPTPQDAQVPRAGLFVGCPNQPEQTKMTWTVSAPTVFAITSGGGVDDTSLSGKGIKEGTFTVTCKYKLTYNNGLGSDTFECNDDTTTTPSQLDPTKMRVNSTNVHKPDTTTEFSKSGFRPSSIVQNGPNGTLVRNANQAQNATPFQDGGTMCGDIYSLNLISTLGKKMPCVWVQERFEADAGLGITMPPSNFYVNVNSQPSWCTSGTEDIDRLGVFYHDYLWLWGNPGANSPVSYIHRYYAATRSTTNGGIAVGRWKMTFTLGTTANSIGTTAHAKISAH